MNYSYRMSMLREKIMTETVVSLSGISVRIVEFQCHISFNGREQTEGGGEHPFIYTS